MTLELAALRIGGLVSCSLSDFPGRIAAVVFTQGCNWRCPWCHNPALVYPERFTPSLEVESVLRQLAALRGKLDGVVVSGGEPTLHRGLPEFLRRLRALGLQTKLDTNGSRPEIVEALLAERLVDFVAVDVKAPWPRYAEAAGVAVDTNAVAATIALVREAKVEHQLRTTRWLGLTDADTPDIGAIVAGSPHVWQDYRAVEAVQ
jgi:pyruvate formate lyase activating enzyme